MVIITKSPIQLAVTSRLITIFVQFISNVSMPNHNADAYKNPGYIKPVTLSDNIVELLFSGFRRWDAEYYLQIAENGYIYENSLAFYPIFPFLINIIARSIACIIGDIISFQLLILIVAITINFVAFIYAAQALFRLSLLVFHYNVRMSKLVVFLFCFNPATIFFSAAYCESLFAWTSFVIMEKSLIGLNKSIIIPLSVNLLCRSNGLVNLGFIIYATLRNIVEHFDSTVAHLLKLVFITSSSFIFYIVYQTYVYFLFCSNLSIQHPRIYQEYGMLNNYVLSGSATKSSEWCNYSIPISYSYIQSKYWNVGFLRYYEFKQIPNFLLALPVLSVAIWCIHNYVKDNLYLCLRLGFNKQLKILASYKYVFMVHGIFLVSSCIFFIHIQVSTRFILSTSPIVYWFIAEKILIDCQDMSHDKTSLRHFVRYVLEENKTFSKYIIFWFVSYFLLGIALFSNNYPWT